MASHTLSPRETDSLLGIQTATRRKRSPFQSLVRYFSADIDTRHSDLILLFCYIITGLLDSSAVFIWGSFASMQTGNTVYLGLGLTGADTTTPNRWIKAATSITSFCIGSLCFSSFHRWGSLRRRWVLCASFTIQMLCVAVAASIVTINHNSSRDSQLDWKGIFPLSLVAFQSSGQAVLSRVLNSNGLTSVVLTSVYCDLFSFPGFSNSTSPASLFGLEQRRRVGAVACMMLGVLLGGLWAKSSVGVMGALWMVVFGKALIVLSWVFWRGRN